MKKKKVKKPIKVRQAGNGTKPLVSGSLPPEVVIKEVQNLILGMYEN